MGAFPEVFVSYRRITAPSTGYVVAWPNLHSLRLGHRYFSLRRGSSLAMHCENSAASDAADATGIRRFKRDTR
jgi:hypothetical protein